MITSILECPDHGKQGIVTLSATDRPEVYLFVAQMTDGRSINGFAGISPPPTCSQCSRGLEMFSYHG